MNLPANLPDASSLAATVERARALLDEGDVIAAKVLAAHAYDDAKSAVRLARKFEAGKALVEKAIRLQGESLLIETEAKIMLAEHWDAAQKAGLVSKGGRPTKYVDHKNDQLSAGAIGVSRSEIMVARKLRDVEAHQPGAIKRLIAERVEHHISPSRAMLRGLYEGQEWPVSKGGFHRKLTVEFDSLDTSHNQLGMMIERLQRMSRFLKAVQAHGVPVDCNAPLSTSISNGRLEAMWEDTK